MLSGGFSVLPISLYVLLKAVSLKPFSLLGWPDLGSIILNDVQKIKTNTG